MLPSDLYPPPGVLGLKGLIGLQMLTGLGGGAKPGGGRKGGAKLLAPEVKTNLGCGSRDLVAPGVPKCWLVVVVSSTSQTEPWFREKWLRTQY